jgi:hypothetical protein
VRVSALVKPDSVTDLSSATSLAGLAETDASGRYRLENIPPGRYYIAAGRIDLPTYYPGTAAASEGISILVTPGLTIPGFDFVLNNLSAGRAGPIVGSPPVPSWVIPTQTRVEGGGKVPIFAEGGFPALRLTSSNGSRVEAAPGEMIVTDTDYRATVEYLPPNYVLKSLTFGSTDLKGHALQLASAAPPVAGPNRSPIPVPQFPKSTGPSKSRTGMIHELARRA